MEPEHPDRYRESDQQLRRPVRRPLPKYWHGPDYFGDAERGSGPVRKHRTQSTPYKGDKTVGTLGPSVSPVGPPCPCLGETRGERVVTLREK